MNKLNKKIVILSIISFVLLISLGISVYAYFQATSNKAVEASTVINDENVIEITSFSDLFSNSKAENYNDSKEVSTTSNRTILRLTNDITLPFDLEITNDIHLDLNLKTLDLNGHELTFRHGYMGCFSMYGGIINTGSDGSGRITIDLANASFTTNDISYYNNKTKLDDGTSLTNILHIDEKYSAYQALYYVQEEIASNLNTRVNKATYEEVSNETFSITADKFIPEKAKCTFNSNNACVCSYVYKDLVLPKHYLSTDIEIEYESNNTSYLTNDGVFTAPSQEQDVNFVATVKSDAWDNEYSVTFKLHLVNLSNTTIKDKVAKDLILNYIDEYYVADSLVVSEDITISNYYDFKNAIDLPLSAFDGNISYSYKMTDYESNDVTTTSHTDGSYYVLEPNMNCFHLNVYINGNSEPEILNMYSTYVSDYETIARLLINEMYGGSVVYNSSDSSLELYKINDLSTILSENMYNLVSRYNISNISYALKEGSEAETYYTCENDILTVIGTEVTPVKTSYLTITFTFGEGIDATPIDVDVYIDYLATSGDTLAGFLKYYNAYDPMVLEEVPPSFTLPFSFYGSTPYTCYDISYQYEKITTTGLEENFSYYTYTLGIPDCLSVTLKYSGGTLITFSSSTTSLTAQLDAYLATNNKTLAQLASYEDIEYEFSLNVQKASEENLDLILIYNYKLKASDAWTQYNYTVQDNGVDVSYLTELNVSTFRILGALFYNTSSSAVNAIKDKYFFKWIYDNFNPNNETILISNINSTSYILVDWLSLDVALDVSKDDTLANVSDFSGIGNLDKVTKVNLSGVTLNSSILESISKMASVTTLNLSGCGIEDITDICTMTTIKTLDLSNNSIKDFSDLVNIDDLIDVFVFGNYTTSTIYGSLGIINFQTYTDLIRDGISVYNQESGGIGVLYADSDDYNDYVRLKAIIYQDKLSKDVSIKTLYDGVYTGFDDTSFNLTNTTSGSFKWSYQTTDKDGNTYTEYTATYFQVTYSFKSNNVTYNLVCKYYVDRY